MRLVLSIKVAERISIDFGRFMRIALGSWWHVSQGKFETIEQNNNSAVILCLFLLLLLLFFFFSKMSYP